MNESMNALLATYADHNLFLTELASWLHRKSRQFDNLNGSYNDVADAADMLYTAAGSNDEDDEDDEEDDGDEE